MGKRPTYEELEEKIAELERASLKHKKTRRALKERESPDNDLFQNSLIPQTEMDCSALKIHFDVLRESGVKDFRTFFEENIEAAHECLDYIKHVRVNNAALRMFKARSLKDYQENINEFVKDEKGFQNYARGMAAMAEGRTSFEGERTFKPRSGDPIYVRSSWYIPPGCEKTLSRVYTAKIDISERKRMEDELKRSEQHLANAQQIIGLGSWEWDLVNDKIFGSDEIYRLYGLEPQSIEFTRDFVFHSIHPDDRERVAEEIEDALRGEKPYLMESRIQLPDGTVKHLYIRGQITFDDSGIPIRGIGATLDITFWKDLEERRRVHLAQWEIIESLSKLGTTDWHLPTDEVIWSDESYRIVGLDPEKDTLTRDYYNSLIHPEDKEKVEQAYKDLAEGDHRFDLEYRIVRPDGTIRWLHVRAVLLLDSEGKFERTLSSALDITERVANESALRDREEKYRALYENAVVPMFRTSIKEGRALAVNGIGAELFGYTSREQFLSEFKVADHYVDPSDRAKLLSTLKKNGEIFNHQVLFKKKDGSSFWTEFNAKIYPEEGYLEGAISDITPRILAEEQLRQTEDRFRSLFEDSPVPLFEADCSGLKRYFDELRASGVRNLRTYFKTHPDDAERTGLLVETTNANQAAISAFKAESREMLIEGFGRLGGKLFQEDWTNIVIAFAEGKQNYRRDTRLHTFKGDIRNFAMKWSVPEASAETLDRVYIATLDITNRKKMEQALKRSEADSSRKAEKLEETNIALDVLLGKRLSDRKELEETMLYNVKELVLPYLQKLKNVGLEHRQKTYVGILERNLGNIMSPFLRGMSIGHLRFTPSELQIVDCLKEGLSTRQMAELFDLSPRTVESYRDNIREKLGIKKKKLNLRTYLMTKG